MRPFSNPTFLAAIVNGRWIAIDPGIISDVPGYGRGFIWRPPISVGEDVVIVAGDIYGKATGGGMVMRVGSGTPFENPTGDVPRCPPSNTFNVTGLVIGIVLAVVSVFITVALAILLFVKRRRRQRQNNAPTVTESKRDERGVVRGQGLPGGSDRQPSYYLPEPMSSFNPAMQVQFESPSYYHLEPFPNRSTTVVDTPSTGNGEVVIQPQTHSGTYTSTGLGTRTDGLQRPWSTSGKRVSTSSMCRPLTIYFKQV